jgi:AraC-like DNA-binding protein
MGIRKRVCDTVDAKHGVWSPYQKTKQAAGPSVSVTNVATNWGFWDPGHFARDYRAMFRELPSATLTRARQG